MLNFKTVIPYHKILFVGISLIVLWTFTVSAQQPSIPFSDEEKLWLAKHPTLRPDVGVAFPPFMMEPTAQKGNQRTKKGRNGTGKGH